MSNFSKCALSVEVHTLLCSFPLVLCGLGLSPTLLKTALALPLCSHAIIGISLGVLVVVVVVVLPLLGLAQANLEFVLKQRKKRKEKTTVKRFIAYLFFQLSNDCLIKS